MTEMSNLDRVGVSQKTDEVAKKSILTTWTISLQAINERDPHRDAVTVMRSMAIFGRTNVVLDVLVDQTIFLQRLACRSRHPSEGKAENHQVATLSKTLRAEQQVHLSGILRALLDYSLIYEGSQRDSYSMHPVVHELCLSLRPRFHSFENIFASALIVCYRHSEIDEGEWTSRIGQLARMGLHEFIRGHPFYSQLMTNKYQLHLVSLRKQINLQAVYLRCLPIIKDEMKERRTVAWIFESPHLNIPVGPLEVNSLWQFLRPIRCRLGPECFERSGLLSNYTTGHDLDLFHDSRGFFLRALLAKLVRAGYALELLHVAVFTFLDPRSLLSLSGSFILLLCPTLIKKLWQQLIVILSMMLFESPTRSTYLLTKEHGTFLDEDDVPGCDPLDLYKDLDVLDLILIVYLSRLVADFKTWHICDMIVLECWRQRCGSGCGLIWRGFPIVSSLLNISMTNGFVAMWEMIKDWNWNWKRADDITFPAVMVIILVVPYYFFLLVYLLGYLG